MTKPFLRLLLLTPLLPACKPHIPQQPPISQPMNHPTTHSSTNSITTSSPKLLPPHGAYHGAYIDFGPTEDNATLEAIEYFESITGKRLAIIASSSYWGQESFPTKNVQIITRHGAVPLIFWSPWDKPYKQEQPSNRFSLLNILNGQCDPYIIHWANEAKKIIAPLLVAWGIEMNGNWFPWSGIFYGGGNQTNSGYQGPETYKKAYKYVVNLCRSQGALNIQWLFHANNSSNPDEPWNQIHNYYPGPDYVDWLALSCYGQQYPNSSWIPVNLVFKKAFQEIAALDPNKPILLAEWGVGEFPNSGNRPAWLTEAFALLKSFSRLKSAVFWHERWQNGDGSYSNLRIDASPDSLQAYRNAIADPFWLPSPILAQ